LIERFGTAFQFLTAIPFFEVKEFSEEQLAKSMAAFPLVGATLGLILALVHFFLGQHLPPLVEGVLLVALLAWATGGFHLDGVADTIDGLAGGWTRERTLEIMKDSRVGAVGATALILVIFLKASAIGYLPDDIKFRALIATLAASRGAVVFMAFGSKYARPKAGLGTPYTNHLTAEITCQALGLSALISLVAGLPGLVGFLASWGWANLLKGHFRKKLGGVTGDVLGFAEETGEIVFLLAFHLMV
jgi:adenosylcobinamide-GDP ribazoletransferase